MNKELKYDPPSAYLAQYEKYMKRAQFISSTSLDQLVRDTLAQASVASFQNILVAVQFPNHVKALRNNTLMPALMRLLRDTMASNPHAKLFDSYFGFLSATLILRTIEVGVLSRLNILAPFVGLAMLDTKATITQSLTEAVIHELRSSMSVDIPRASLSLFKSGVLLPEVGGLGHEDLLFLLEALWADRKQFLMITSRGSLLSLGWSAIFCVALKQFEAKPSTTREQWVHLFRLVYRYRLCTSEKDEGLAGCICEAIQTRLSSINPEMAGHNDCADEEDARLIMQAYIAGVETRSKSKGEFPSSMSLVLASHAPFDAIVKMKAYYLAPSYIKASIKHMWGELAMVEKCYNLDDPGVEKAIEQIYSPVCHITANYNIILITENMSQEQRLAALRALAAGEFMQILGRTLLANAMHLATGIKQDYGGCQIWHKLILELKRMITMLEGQYIDGAHQMFDDCYSDLRKAYRQNKVIMGLFEPTHSLYKFARDSFQVLKRLLKALGGSNRHEFNKAVPRISCAYSRCPAVCQISVSTEERGTTCEGCLVTNYCSEECQIRDWEFRYPRPHHTDCGTAYEAHSH